MDHVLARVKRLRKNPYRKLLSDTTLYPSVSLDSVSTTSYNPDHNLDEDAWFAIEKFSATDFFLDELDGDIDSKEYDDLKKADFQHISHLLCLQGSEVYFQKVTPSSFIKRKMIQFGEAAHLEDSADRIVVKAEPDAIYFRSDDTLLFKDIASISSIFKGVDQLYREATEDQVKEFLGSDFISLAGSYSHESVSKPNRKRLALVADTLKDMSPEQRAHLIEYIKDYCQERLAMSTDETSFEVSNDRQLKLILYGIEERFYTTVRSQQRRLANSVETLS